MLVESVCTVLPVPWVFWIYRHSLSWVYFWTWLSLEQWFIQLQYKNHLQIDHSWIPKPSNLYSMWHFQTAPRRGRCLHRISCLLGQELLNAMMNVSVKGDSWAETTGQLCLTIIPFSIKSFPWWLQTSGFQLEARTNACGLPIYWMRTPGTRLLHGRTCKGNH